MLTKAEALELATVKMSEICPPDVPGEIVDEGTIERSFGWVFFYNSMRYLQTGRFSDRFAGNGPIIVNKFDGSVKAFGASIPVDQIMEEYERTWNELQQKQSGSA